MADFGVDVLVSDKVLPHEPNNIVKVPAGYAYKLRLSNGNYQRALARVFYYDKQVDEEVLPANNFNDIHTLFAAPAVGIADKIKVEFHLEKQEVKGRFGIDFNVDIFPHPRPYYPPPPPYYPPPYNPYYPPPPPYPYPYRQEAPVQTQEQASPAPSVVRSVSFEPEVTTVQLIIEGT